MWDIYVKGFGEECLLGQAAKEVVKLTTPRRAVEPLVPPDGRRAAHIIWQTLFARDWKKTWKEGFPSASSRRWAPCSRPAEGRSPSPRPSWAAGRQCRGLVHRDVRQPWTAIGRGTCRLALLCILRGLLWGLHAAVVLPFSAWALRFRSSATKEKNETHISRSTLWLK